MTAIAILIPTVHRPDSLQAVLNSAHAATASEHRVYFIAEAEDRPTRGALKRLRGDHTDIVGDFGSCARAMNIGFEHSTEPAVFTGNDDLRFTEGWDTAALEALDRHPIVGTNDGNGRMTCFAMVRRSFIEQHSGVFDEPGTLYHPGYLSQYVDTELASYARHRGVWGEAPAAVTVHLHWEFGLADRDHPNYHKAQETCGEDHRRYEQRRQEWQAQVVLSS